MREDEKIARVKRRRVKEKRDGVAEGGRDPTGKGWNRGRTVNLTIYPLRRGRGVRSEEARKR